MRERPRDRATARDRAEAQAATPVGRDERRPDRSRAGAATEALAVGTSRRGLLNRVAKALVATTAGGVAAKTLAPPGEAQAFNFCGHIWTTGNCPHPTGLPRVDARGFPLRGRDGHPVDDLGRPVDRRGRPVERDGSLMRDPAGRPEAVASRTRVCTVAGKRYGFTPHVDGVWYRCCGGKVRKLVDCCSTGERRINGDQALTGYCAKGRKVFCVMYFQTSVPC